MIVNDDDMGHGVSILKPAISSLHTQNQLPHGFHLCLQHPNPDLNFTRRLNLLPAGG
jgi:hypothetical protein